MLKSYSVFQIRDEKLRKLGFLSLKFFRKFSNQPTTIDMQDIYEKVYSGTTEDSEGALEQLFHRFNVEHPSGYIGRSMSIGDIIQLSEKYYYCDIFGFTEVEVKLTPSTEPAKEPVRRLGYITTNPAIHVCDYKDNNIVFQSSVSEPMSIRTLKTSKDGRQYFIFKGEKIYL